MSELKTTVNDASVVDFISAVDDAVKRQECSLDILEATNFERHSS